MAKASKSTDPDYLGKLALYEKLVATLPGVERKGEANPYTSLNGHMFSYLHPSGDLALRLPEDVRAEFLKAHKSQLFEAYGVVQEEYVRAPEKLLADTRRLSPYFKASRDYVAALKPKPTTRPKAGAKKPAAKK